MNVIYLKESYLDGAERYFIEVMKKLFRTGSRDGSTGFLRRAV